MQNCIICEKTIEKEGIHLCNEHTLEIFKSYTSGKNTIQKADSKYHCQICGEWENRDIIIASGWCYICSVCLIRALEAYNKL